ncbi:efflux RND transporter permease subunit [Deltaproteobacteria bacterium]|nr:efflux RND transporter permease subunit [Deltaproteobacteria bacterium]
MPDQYDRRGIIHNVVKVFLSSRLSFLFIIAAFSLGAIGVLFTPKEEEPQIVVPIADVFVQVPGASAEEVEKLVTTPLERLLWQIDGVEYVYSVSHRDAAVVTVRFYVGEDREKSLIKLHNAITMNLDLVPPIVQNWLVKPVEIDDVPIVALTLYSQEHNDHELRRVGEEFISRLSEVENISRIQIIGGRPREIRVELDPERLTGYNVSPIEVFQALGGSDTSVTAGSYLQKNEEIIVRSNLFLSSAGDVTEVVVGVFEGRPVYLRDVANVTDGPEEAGVYSRIGFSNRYLSDHGQSVISPSFPAVTLALSKKKGTNAVNVAREIISKSNELRESILPSGMRMEITRNYGKTAQEKVNNLLGSLFFAILTVIALLAITLGRREAIIVALAVPISFSLSLAVNYLFGYTINRVTLFALILSLGLVVDDPITNVDNIRRHILMRKKHPSEATLDGVSEVLPPVIMSTLAIIVSFTPMFFITGMMGPYMAPMATNVPLTVTASTLTALTVVPWLSYMLLKKLADVNVPGNDRKEAVPPWIDRYYRALVSPFLDSFTKRIMLVVLILLLLTGSALLPLLGQVPLKMLPFDNKNEFQIVIDMPEGTTLESTDRVVRAFEAYLTRVSEVSNFVTYAGTASPMDFNGMVRHYYLRDGENVADIRVNLADKSRRTSQSHEIVLRLRDDLTEIAKKHGADIKIVEVPPGPPVLSTITTEIYGEPDMTYDQILDGSEIVRGLMIDEPFVTDVDTSAESLKRDVNFWLDKEKAALHGVSSESVTKTLRLAISGESPATVHESAERQPLPVRLILPRLKRSSIDDLSQIPLKGESGKIVQLGELGEFFAQPSDQPIYHKNLKRVAFVYGEMAGRSPVEAVLSMKKKMELSPITPGIQTEWAGEGEWGITVRVFRDLGFAYAAAMMGIFILLVIQTRSYLMPLLIMTAIPLTIIGIMPGFWLLNFFFAHPVGSYQNPIFFTATSMIGMIALGGIVIRNSLVLIEFVQDSLMEGLSLKEAILKSGAVRMRPIVLTALTTALGAWPITLDPIFSGLAWALITGLFASTAFTLIFIPVAYYSLFKDKTNGANNSLHS